MTSLDYGKYLKDMLETHGHVTHYPFMFNFHPDFTCENIRIFSEKLVQMGKFKRLHYSNEGSSCIIRVMDISDLAKRINF